MYAYQRQSLRPDNSIPFCNFTEEEALHIKTVYQDTGKQISTSVTEDAHIQIIKTEWENETEYSYFNNDPVIISFVQRRDAYNRENNIISVRTVL
jgi:hypothetical protein